MRRSVTVALALLLGGCASNGMSEAECRMADWRAIGFEDGSWGRAASSFGGHRKACADHGVASSFDDYLAGHAQGLETFCRPENAARLGASGHRYSGICPEHLEAAFVDAHAESYGLYERHAALDGIGRRLNAKRNRAKTVEHLVVQKTAKLLAPGLPGAERASLVVELKQLGEERHALEEAIHHLELDYADAEREYESYRSRIASSAL